RLRRALALGLRAGALALLPSRRPAVRSSFLRAKRNRTMSSTTWLRWLIRGAGRGRRCPDSRPRPARRPSFLPHLLPLEDRLCLSWRTPVDIGPLINLPGTTQNQVAVSPDALSVYFESDRSGGLGSTDLYVSHRDSPDAAWGEPQNLGPNINS